jgi:hypothetical protein
VVETVLPGDSLSPLLIRLSMPAETSLILNTDIVVTRGWAAEEIGIFYLFSDDKKELSIYSANKDHGWDSEHTYAYTVSLYNDAEEKITESGFFTTGNKLKGDIPSLSVSYNYIHRIFSWLKDPNAEVYDLYIRDVEGGDYVLLCSVPDDGKPPGYQSVAIFDFLEPTSWPYGVYLVKVIGRNTLRKGNLAYASERGVEYYDIEFPPLEEVHYDPQTYILSWKEPMGVSAWEYFIYAKKEGEQEYRKVHHMYIKEEMPGNEIDIIYILRDWGWETQMFGTYQIKVICRILYPDMIGSLENATTVTVEYPNTVLPPLTLVSKEDKKIIWGWGTNIPYWTSIYVYVKGAEEADSEYERVGEYYNYVNYPNNQITLLASAVLKDPSYLYGAEEYPAGTYIFKAVFYDYDHNWYSSFEDAVPVVYEYDGLGDPDHNPS